MTEFSIKNITGDYNVFGDQNQISNTVGGSQLYDKVLTRNDYFQMILEIREIERISLSDYLEDKFQKFSQKNPDFIKILYKDIINILNGVGNEEDNDLIIKDGDFVIEYSDIKLTGKQSNLHYTLIWLHAKILDYFTDKNPLTIIEQINLFETDFLKINYDTPEYSKKLIELGLEIQKEINPKKKSRLSFRFLNDIIQIKPNFGGVGIDFNVIIDKLIK